MQRTLQYKGERKLWGLKHNVYTFGRLCSTKLQGAGKFCLALNRELLSIGTHSAKAPAPHYAQAWYYVPNGCAHFRGVHTFQFATQHNKVWATEAGADYCQEFPMHWELPVLSWQAQEKPRNLQTEWTAVPKREETGQKTETRRNTALWLHNYCLKMCILTTTTDLWELKG